MTWEDLLTIVGFVVSGLGGIICFILWYLLSGTIADMRALKTELDGHKLDVAMNYARSMDVNTQFKALHECIDNVEKTVQNIAIDMGKVVTKLEALTK